MKEAIVFYAAPTIGHVFSMAELAKLVRHSLLLRHPGRQLSFTFLYGSDPFEPPATEASFSRVITSNPSISFVRLPHRPIDTSPTRSRAAIAFQSIRLSAPDVADALRRISETGTKIRALIIDMFTTTALPIGSEMGIPVYYFFTSGAAALAAYLHMPVIHRMVGGRVFKDSPELVIEIPGLPAIPATEMPEPLLDARDPAYPEMVYFCESFGKSEGILVNTFDELETVAMAAIVGGACVPDGPTPPVYNIGPLIEASKDDNNSNRHHALSWLDGQPCGSVVFMCFGSRGKFTTTQIKEIAKGLEKSRQRFLWVVKSPVGDETSEINLEEMLPKGFLERTKGVGLVVEGWAPQVMVLNHDSVGGFVTHCGWNSVLEAVVAGKPMVAWPLYAEQHLNRAALVSTMGMAIRLHQREGDRFVTEDELARGLVELMDSARGRELKEKSGAMRVRALAAVEDGGSSMLALEKLANKWME